MDFNFKLPASKEEMDELRKSLRSELSLDDLDAVVGGNDDIKEKGKMSWTCGYCGVTLTISNAQEAALHIVHDCPNNPYKTK